MIIFKQTQVNVSAFQPKTSRQMVQQLSRRLTEKNKFDELQHYLSKIENSHRNQSNSDNITNKLTSKIKYNKAKNSGVSKSKERNFIFKSVSREKRSRIEDPEAVRTFTFMLRSHHQSDIISHHTT